MNIDKMKQVLSYDPESGAFTWKITGGKRKAGAIAGRITRRGYRVIGIFRMQLAAHRLAWAFVHGSFPTGMLDHINCDRSDNRISNLREATASTNTANSRLRANNACGFKGVYWNKSSRSWCANIRVNGKLHWLGTHATPELAHAAYMAAARVHFGEFARAA